MVNEFNKIVGDVLATEGAVTLPGVGALVVVRRAAERISSRRLRRSCNAVIFTDEAQGRSIVDAVAAACGIDDREAHDIYERWRTKSTADGVLAIDGVGHISRRRFFVDESFDRLLNPNGHQVVELANCRRNRTLAYLLRTVAVVAVVAGIGWLSGVYERRGEIMQAVAAWLEPKEEQPAQTDWMVADAAADGESVQRERAGGDDADGVDIIDNEAVADDGAASDEGLATEVEGQPSESQAEPDQHPDPQTDQQSADSPTDPQPDPQSDMNPDIEPQSAQNPQDTGAEEEQEPSLRVIDTPRQPQPTQQSQPPHLQLTQPEPTEGIGRLTSGRNYVVYGVFSTPENALRAVADIRRQGENGCSAFAYGPKYMVALYHSENAAECNAYIRNAKDFSNLWVYAAH